MPIAGHMQYKYEMSFFISALYTRNASKIMSNVTWQDFEKNQYGVTRGGLSGMSGDMPPELHMQKLEQTCMYEREDQLDDFFRSTLKDRTPDQASMAQDLPRTTQNTIRSEVLNIRHSAARTPAEPIHPDLFLGFTERDTRGHHNAGPDMKQYNKHSRARVKFKDLVSDHASDWTIPEGPRSEMRAIRDLRKTIDATRGRMKIFDTARDNLLIPAGNSRMNEESRVVKTTIDGTILNLNDAQEVNQRKDNTKLRSDNIKVGYRTTGDHKFSVAQYSILGRKEQKRNIASSQYKNKTSHKFDVAPSEIKNRLSINILKEVGRRKHLNAYTGEMGFNESVNNQNKIKKMTKDLTAAQQSTVQTADTVDLGYVSKNIQKVRVYDPVAHDTVIVDKEIFDKVRENKNVKFVKKTDNSLKRSVRAEEGKVSIPGDESQTYVYSRKNPQFDQHLPTKMEHKWYDTKFAPMYKQNHTKFTGMDHQATAQGQGVDPHADKVFNRYKSGKSQPWEVQKGMDTDVFNFDPVNDADASTISHRQMAGRTKR